MEKKLRSIHVFNSDLQKISLCLSNCQIRETNRFQGVLTFYCIQKDKVISIYSSAFDDYFDTKEIGRWFAGENNEVFLLDYLNDSFLRIDLFKKYKFLTPLVLQKDVDGIRRQSFFKMDEIQSVFGLSQRDFRVDFHSIEESLTYFAALFQIPFDQGLSDVIGNPKAEKISFYVV